MKLCSLSVTVILLLGASATFAGDWTEFRGSSKQGIAAAGGLPLTWSETEHVTWKVSVPGAGWSSPVVQGGRIFLTTAVPEEIGVKQPQSLQVHCLDAAVGETIWQVEVFRQPGGDEIQIHQKNSHASPTPVIEGDRLYVHFGPHGTACLRTNNGAVVWKTQKLEYKPTHGTGGSPAIAGDLLVICCDGQNVQYVVGLDKRTGDVRWKTPRDTTPQKGFSFCTPRIIEAGGRRQAICPGSDAVFSYDPATGEEIWRVRYGDGYSVVPRPVVGHGLVYVCSGFSDQRLLAIDPTGTGDVTESGVEWELSRGVPKSSSVLLVGDEVFLVDDRGIATCVDARTGRVHWQQRLGGNFSASPLFAAGRVYFQDENGVATVIKASTRFEKLARNELAPGERTFASYAVTDDAILLRSERHLYRIEQ